MAKFIAIIKTEPACDYSIGCGVRVVDITADNKEAAFNKLLKDSHYCDVASGDAYPDSLEDEKLRLIEVADEDTKIYDKWLRSMTSKHERMEKEKAAKKDEAEFERLKKKLGK